MQSKILFEFDINDEFKLKAIKKWNYNWIHNDSLVFLNSPDKCLELSDSSFTDEFGYSMYHRFFNIKEFDSLENYVNSYIIDLQKQKNGLFDSDFDESSLFSCTSLQRNINNEDYFFTLNLIKADNKYVLLFLEGDFDVCNIRIIENFEISYNKIKNWKKKFTKIFELELKNQFNIYNSSLSETQKEKEFEKFLLSIKSNEI